MRVSTPYLDRDGMLIVGGPHESEKSSLATTTCEEVRSIVAEGIDISTLKAWGTEKAPKTYRDKRAEQKRL